MGALIALVFIMAGIALVWWGAERLNIPQPVKVFLMVVLGLVALILMYRALTGLVI